jgi:hypothetical protein
MLLLRRCEIKYGDRQIPIRSGKFAQGTIRTWQLPVRLTFMNSPREAAGAPREFGQEGAAELADLQRRVGELKRRMRYSWIVHPNFFLRILAVFGYWIVGCAILALIGKLSRLSAGPYSILLIKCGDYSSSASFSTIRISS